jgi:hypothetical protein
VFKVRTGLLFIIVGMLCLVGIPSIPVFAGSGAGIDASVTVIVLTDVTITPVSPTVTIPSGGSKTLQLNASGNYTDGTGWLTKDLTGSVNWVSSNTSVATIDSSGLATALTAGSTTISATLSGKTGNTTLQVSIQSSGGDSGGGGGGGGGGSSGTTSLSDYTTSEGKFVVEAKASSADFQAWIIFPKNTVARDRNGGRLRFISFKEQTVVPIAPADRRIVCLTYDIGPGGSTFIPPAYLVFKFSDSQIPLGIDVNKMVIVTHEDGKWIELDDCIVNTVDKTIKVLISHLSMYTVMARTGPANFEIKEMKISPDEIYPDETVTISTTVTNTGDLTGSKNIVLKINGTEVQTQTVTLDGGASVSVQFTITPDAGGLYTADINGFLRSFTVSQPESGGTVAEVTEPTTEPASFTISDLQITPAEVYPSAQVTISALVNNIGGREGSYTVVFKVDNKEELLKEVSLKPGTSEKLYFYAIKDELGSHTVDVNGQTGQFTVKFAPPATTPAETPTQEPTTSVMMTLIIFIVLLVIAGILVFLYRRFSRSREEQ